MDMMLAKVDAAERALAEAKALPEVQNIRDQAEALRYLAKQAKLGLGKQNEIAEIKIRAERKAGEMLNELVPALGGRPPKNRATDSGFFPRLTLEGLGIKPHQFRNWRLESSVPEDIFNLYTAYVKYCEKELTSAGVLELANWLRRQETATASPVAADEAATEPAPDEYADCLYKDNWLAMWNGDSQNPFIVVDNAVALVVSNGTTSRCYILEPAPGFSLYFGQSV